MGVKNKGGSKFKKQKRDSGFKRELVFREDEQSYARIIKSLGDSRFECECLELNEMKIGLVRGTFRRRIWMGMGDIILVSLRDFDRSKCDIIHKYTFDEANNLKNMGEIPSHIKINATILELTNDNDNDDECDEFDFEAI